MGYCRQIELPTSEPVTRAEVRGQLRLPATITADDSLIDLLIIAAREYGEIRTNRSLAQRRFVKTLDAFPYYIDAIQGGQGYPPGYYSLPKYATTMWNYSQQIKLDFSPTVRVDELTYINTAGDAVTLTQDTDFILDNTTELSRLFPLPGRQWPANAYTPNSVKIIFTAGHDSNPAATEERDLESPPLTNPPNQQPVTQIVTGIPALCRLAILRLVNHWYRNPGSTGKCPEDIDMLFANQKIWDFAPTVG